MAMNYAFTGQKWGDNEITWSFGAKTYAKDASTPFSSSIGAAYQADVKAAAAKWDAASGLTFKLVADPADPALAPDIRVGFDRFDGATRVGEASWSYSTNYAGQALMDPGAVSRLRDPLATALIADANGKYYYQGTPTTLYQTALHEFGHVLGLSHSTDPTSVMYPTIGPDNRDLNASDLAGIQALYGTNAAPIVNAVPDRITVRASATQAGGVGAKFRLIADGVTLGEATVNTASNSVYSFDTKLAGGASAAHNIRVQYVNDATINGQDRNLFLSGISVNGVWIPATSPMEVYHANTLQGAKDIAGSGNMFWGGTAEFKLPAGTVPKTGGTGSSSALVPGDAGPDGAQAEIAHPGALEAESPLFLACGAGLDPAGDHGPEAGHPSLGSLAAMFARHAGHEHARSLAGHAAAPSWDDRAPQAFQALAAHAAQAHPDAFPGDFAALFEHRALA